MNHYRDALCKDGLRGAYEAHELWRHDQAVKKHLAQTLAESGSLQSAMKGWELDEGNQYIESLYVSEILEREISHDLLGEIEPTLSRLSDKGRRDLESGIIAQICQSVEAIRAEAYSRGKAEELDGLIERVEKLPISPMGHTRLHALRFWIVCSAHDIEIALGCFVACLFGLLPLWLITGLFFISWASASALIPKLFIACVVLVPTVVVVV